MSKSRRILNQAMIEVVETQLRDSNPPETKQTYERLLAEGFSEKEAKTFIACVIACEIYDIMKFNKPFDLARYCEALSRLPTLPDE